MNSKSVFRTGLALSLTVAVAYTFCTILYALWPDQGMVLLNDLFHGLDFRKLGAPSPITLSMFVLPLIVLSVWSFLVGALFEVLHGFLSSGVSVGTSRVGGAAASRLG